MEFQTIDEVHIQFLITFYKKHPNVIDQRIIPIVEGKSPISLRFLEYFITKYCQKNKIIIKRKIGNGSKFISIYDEYKDQLNSFDKRHFDLFKRSNKILFKSNKHSFFMTTIGQLNFFRWLIESGILDYIEENIEELKKQKKSDDLK